MRKFITLILCLTIINAFAGYSSSSGGRSGFSSSGRSGFSSSSYSGGRSYGSSSYSRGGSSGFISNRPSYSSSSPSYNSRSYSSGSTSHYSSTPHTTVINNNSHGGSGSGFWSGFMGGYLGGSLSHPGYMPYGGYVPYGAQPVVGGAAPPMVLENGGYAPVSYGYSYPGATIFFTFLLIAIFIAFVLWILLRDDHNCR